VIGAIVVVTLPVDLVWHELGRRRGSWVLSGLCRMTLEPDVCASNAKFVSSLRCSNALVSKFIPGMTTVLPPLAGCSRRGCSSRSTTSREHPVGWCLDGPGLPVQQCHRDGHPSRREPGRAAVLVVAAVLVGYVVLKYLRRQLFLRRMRMARISAEELKGKLAAGEELVVIDLRTALDVAATPFAIPGSRWIAAEQLDDRLADIPRDRELVLYCS
jgi:hypothetical protein